jgi:hypothetical protein
VGDGDGCTWLATYCRSYSRLYPLHTFIVSFGDVAICCLLMHESRKCYINNDGCYPLHYDIPPITSIILFLVTDSRFVLLKRIHASYRWWLMHHSSSTITFSILQLRTLVITVHQVWNIEKKMLRLPTRCINEWDLHMARQEVLPCVEPQVHSSEKKTCAEFCQQEWDLHMVAMWRSLPDGIVRKKMLAINLGVRQQDLLRTTAGEHGQVSR